MENLLEKLFDQIRMPLEIRESGLFDGATLASVEVDSAARSWHFILKTAAILPVETYKLLSGLIEEAFSGVASTRLSLQADDASFDEQKLNDYYALALSSMTDIAFRDTFGAYRLIIHDGRPSILVADLANIESLAEKHFPSLEAAYKDFGFDYFEFLYEVDPLLNEESGISPAPRRKKASSPAPKKKEIEKRKTKFTSTRLPGSAPTVSLGRDIRPTELATPMKDVMNPENGIVFEGYVFRAEKRDFTNRTTKKVSTRLEIALTDYSSSFIVQKWARGDESAEFDEIVQLAKAGLWVRVKGNLEMDSFKHELVMQLQSLRQVKAKNVRTDKAETKRVEFHAHTNMSAMDALSSASDLVAQAAKWGHSAIAITDHGGVQAFPEAYKAGKQHDIKIIYGLEANLVEDIVPIAYNEAPLDLHEATYVVFDVETTGLSAKYNKLIQIAASKMYKGNVIAEFDEFLNPGHPLSAFTTELTGITDDHVKSAKPLKQVLEAFQDFCKDTVLVAHNATFDVGFMNMNYQRTELPQITQPVIDTLELARNLHPELRYHGLGPLTKRFGIGLEHHHMANFDAEATGRLLFHFLEEARDREVALLTDLNSKLIAEDSYKKARVHHATLYAQNQDGLKNLFKLVSLSNVKYFAGIPRIPKSVLKDYRKGIIVGSACEEGEVWSAITTKSFEQAKEVAKFYDFIEILPPALYRPLISTGFFRHEEELYQAIKDLTRLGEELDKPVLATGNVHYLNPEDSLFREIVVRSLGPGAAINRPIGRGEHALPAPLPEAHFRTTGQMLEEFSFLGTELAQQIVVENTNALAERFESITPVREDLYTPHMEGAEENIARMTYEKAHSVYGNPLPDLIDARLEKELRSIIGHGFSVIYLIAQELVERSNKRGYLVGSRGSVGSSLVATMIGITEVNPLPPHYICPQCQYFEADTDGNYGSGYDMPDKTCPNCGTKLHKDGHNIPFETFLGFKGDKVPDIDLNFSGDDQPNAHLDVREIFGEDYAFRAGTIGTVADKTAYGYVKGYERDYGKYYRNAEIDRLTLGFTGVKRTTGQHPGGIIVIPDYMDVYDFTPVQYPADDSSSEWKTTHFDFHAIHDNILKLDILGHDDPTMIRTLQSLSGIDPKDIPMDDRGVLALFEGTESLGITPEQAMANLGTFGIPEMGTFTSINMISDAKPKTFADLLQISGLSHGTDVWKGNAQDLIKQGIATLSTVIGCRDDIMVYLIHAGLDESTAFKIMEVVRKGQWTKIPDEERSAYIAAMRENKVPNWYIDSCAKIKYMFPKAHATAYIMMALRIAWFKVHRPMDYYCAWFSIRATAYDLATMSGSLQAIKAKIKDIEWRSNSRENPATPREKDLLVTLQLCNEMRERGFNFGKLDLYQSDATDFKIEGETLIPPFKVMDSLGENVARSIVTARKDGEFLSKNELKQRTGLSQTLVEAMATMGVLGDMPEDNQLSLF